MIRPMPDHAEGDHSHAARPAGALRQRGRRLTRQRTAIWEVLTTAPEAHLSAEQIVKKVQEREPGVNASTVYRSLDVLVEEGFVRQTDFGTGRAMYEPTHEHLHHHLVCERCGYVTHVHDEALGNLAERIEARFGFVLGDREVSYFGVCEDCRPTEAWSA